MDVEPVSKPFTHRRRVLLLGCVSVLSLTLLPAAAPSAGQGRELALFVGGSFGPARTLALDADGRTIASGLGRGATTLLSPCPGSRRLAEIAHIRSDTRMRSIYEIAIREVPSLRIVRRHTFKLPGWRFAVGLLCEDSAGSSVVIFAAWAGDGPLHAAIYRLAGRRLSSIWRGTAHLSSLTAEVAYLNAGISTARLVSVDLRTGRITHVAWLPRSPRLVPSDRGTRLAGVAYRLDEKSQLMLVDLETQPPRVRRLALTAPEVTGSVVWINERRLLFLPHGRPDIGRLLDRELATLVRFRWTGGSGVLVGATLFGTDRRGNLVAADVPYGGSQVVRRLQGRVHVMVSAAG